MENNQGNEQYFLGMILPYFTQHPENKSLLTPRRVDDYNCFRIEYQGVPIVELHTDTRSIYIQRPGMEGEVYLSEVEHGDLNVFLVTEQRII